MAAKSPELELLKKIPIFSSLSDAELEGIVNAPENGIEEYASKQVIIKEEDVADCMYVVLEGSADVSLKSHDAMGREVVIATLRVGDFFGEQALHEHTTTGRRKASVRAVHPVKLFRIDKKHVRLGLHHDEDDTSGEKTRTAGLTDISGEAKEVRDLLHDMRLFQSLTDVELNSIGNWTQVLKVDPGEFVVKESERGDCMYVVLEGAVEIFTLDDDGKVIILDTLEKGNYFGEQALMPGSPGSRSAYARTHDVARLIRIPKEYFRLILNRDSEVAKTLLKIGQAQKKQRDQYQKGR